MVLSPDGQPDMETLTFANGDIYDKTFNYDANDFLGSVTTTGTPWYGINTGATSTTAIAGNKNNIGIRLLKSFGTPNSGYAYATGTNKVGHGVSAAKVGSWATEEGLLYIDYMNLAINRTLVI